MVSTEPGGALLLPVPRGILPLLPIAPAIVVVVGITTALVIAVLGISLLQQTADDEARLQARAIAATVAARLGAATVEERSEILKRSSQRPEGSRPLPAVELLLVDRDGRILVNTSVKTPTRDDVLRLLGAADGEARTRARPRPLRRAPPPRGRAPLGHRVRGRAEPPPGSIALVNGVAALTALLLGIAVSVSVAYTKAARDDVDYVRRRIAAMARASDGPSGEPIPIRSLDQVGALTAAFNVLVGRFAAAERSYRADLRQAAEGARERSEFLAGLSHELRTPLNAILGFNPRARERGRRPAHGRRARVAPGDQDERRAPEEPDRRRPRPLRARDGPAPAPTGARSTSASWPRRWCARRARWCATSRSGSRSRGRAAARARGPRRIRQVLTN